MNKVFLIIGICCFLVPFGLQMKDKNEQIDLISTYEVMLESVENDELEKGIEEARRYNQSLYKLQCIAAGGNLAAEPQMDYERILNFTGTGMMGQLQIPKIELQLPIYHGTSDEVLQNGIGHLQGTSFPVGGENTHAVLTGHCGLPSAELFTRLDELEAGDEFWIRICGENYVYEVSEVKVVEPDDADSIRITADRDLVTLVTCTPYGINTHRLLVTGTRIPEEEIEDIWLEDGTGERGINEKVFYVVGAGSLLAVFFMCRGVRRKYRN